MGSCGKPFAWRKKWEKVWDEVRYCSERCRNNKNNSPKFQYLCKSPLNWRFGRIF
ncbi:MAG: DUF2256 domain-containing protein [Lewinellaceae bacterium]|nr:DUF2256 domain-containing protein [Lewinellaceae bacterium]